MARCSSVLATLAAVAASIGGVASATAQTQDALQGCWRSQQVRVFLRDGSFRDQNADCVMEIDAMRSRSRCASDSARTETVSAYDRIAPDRLRVSLLDPSSGAPKGLPSELQYRVEDDWLVMERPLSPIADSADGKQAVRLQSVSKRVRHQSGGVTSACVPRGDTGLRVGRTPMSSLALEVPTGWKALLVDPAKEPGLATAVHTSLLVGVFVRSQFEPDDLTRMVMVLDDVRPGAIPVRAREFAAVKAQIKRDLGQKRVLCDDPDRLCGMLLESDGSMIYTEFVKVAGRVAMVHAVGSSSAALPSLRRSAAAFVRQLRAGAEK